MKFIEKGDCFIPVSSIRVIKKEHAPHVKDLFGKKYIQHSINIYYEKPSASEVYNNTQSKLLIKLEEDWLLSDSEKISIYFKNYKNLNKCWDDIRNFLTGDKVVLNIEPYFIYR